MDAERWKQVDRLLDAALARPPNERDAFLRQTCVDDAALEREVRLLLTAQEQARSFLESPAIDVAARALALAPRHLNPGTRLGPYEILSTLGAGGMGEVYRAKDTRLDRTVALKILPETLAADPQFRDRFDREARAISQLDHPHICGLYDVGEQNGVSFLVLQYLEGETLQERLKKGALRLDEALTIAIQIADALDTAHRRGIVHRDLKPGNVMLTKSGATLLDFGLAKASPPVGSASLSTLPTTPPAAMTAQGTILGTFQYMAPEQIEGEGADARTDIFAFGVVLYEMLTGNKAFNGKSQASLFGAILKEEPPPVSTVQLLTPSTLDRVVKKCLAKEPDRRWQSAGDLHDELQWIAEAGRQPASTGANPSTRRANRLARAVGAIGIVAAIAVGAGAYFLRRPAVDRRAYNTSILPPDGTFFGALSTSVGPQDRFALSPDGRRLAFVATTDDGHSQLWVRSLDAKTPLPLLGTDGAAGPFWSPDSRFIAFFGQGKLKKIDASGGPALTLADAIIGGNGASLGSWNSDDVILFLPRAGSGRLFRVSASGGLPSPVTTLDTKSGERAHEFPFFLPDGRHFLYVVRGTTSAGSASAGPRAEVGGVWVGELSSKERKQILKSGSNASYAQGHLFFLQSATLMAQPFDMGRLMLTGDAVPIAEHIELGGASGLAGAFAVSQTGLVAYQTAAPDLRSQLVWFDRTGKQLSTVGAPTDQMYVELSPDEKRVAVSMLDPARDSRDLWTYDLARDGLRTRFTFDPSDEFNIVWSPDASHIAFNSARKGLLNLYQKAANGAEGEDVLLADMVNNKYATSWSSNGRFILYHIGNANSQTGNDLWVLPLVGDRKPTPVLQTPFNETNGRFSPDGRWIAYMSDEAGPHEVYVMPFVVAAEGEAFEKAPAGKWQISASGGTFPRWRRDGKELFYLSAENKLIAVAVNGQGSAFEVGAAHPLFEVRRRLGRYRGISVGNYDVSGDGQRFLVNAAVAGQTATAPITLVVNWPDLQRK